jgi:hypothetical protein
MTDNSFPPEAKESRFYMCYTRSFPNEIIPLAEGRAELKFNGSDYPEYIELNGPAPGTKRPLLTNATLRWSDKTHQFNQMWEYDTPRVVDAGGYNVQAEYADQWGNIKQSPIETLGEDTPFYPWSIEEYHRWLKEYSDRFLWASAMDYACEERYDSLWSVDRRIEETIENTIEQYEMLDGEYNLLPVLQGRSLDDYLYCYDRFEEAGIPLDAVGLGTVCRISSSNEIIELEKDLRAARDFDYIHGFGVKVSAFRMGATFDSADSQAWVWSASKGEIYRDRGDKLEKVSMSDSSKWRTVGSFHQYHQYAQRLFDYGHGRREQIAPLGEEVEL